MDKAVVGVLGATCLVGRWLFPMLINLDAEVFAFSRKAPAQIVETAQHRPIKWVRLPLSSSSNSMGNPQRIDDWICLMPMWVLPQYFSMLSGLGARRLVALSSTSRFSKTNSSSRQERNLAADLKNAEEVTTLWAVRNSIQLTILRPTMIYGSGRDSNIAVIKRFISIFGFFPLFGTAHGLRQPVHGADVAKACLLALKSSHNKARCFNISGGEVLTYKKMIERIFTAIGKTPRFMHLPMAVFRVVAFVLPLFPRFQGFSAAMAERMNYDQDFDHSMAKKELCFKPRGFEPVDTNG